MAEVAAGGIGYAPLHRVINTASVTVAAYRRTTAEIIVIVLGNVRRVVAN
jgi:hypothetical protein